MISQILHSKIVMKIIKCFSDIDHIWPLQMCLSITGNLTDNGALLTIKFSIAKHFKVNTYINNYNLWLSEKAFIIRNIHDINMLNKRSELISKCRYKKKLLLNRERMMVIIDFEVCLFLLYVFLYYLWNLFVFVGKNID